MTTEAAKLIECPDCGVWHDGFVQDWAPQQMPGQCWYCAALHQILVKCGIDKP